MYNPALKDDFVHAIHRELLIKLLDARVEELEFEK